MTFAARVLGIDYNATGITAIKHTYAGVSTTTETIPSGTSQVVIELWGAGGTGGAGTGTPDSGHGGGGGGAGGYCKKTLALTSTDWGKTMTMVAQDSYPAYARVSSGTKTITSLYAYQGNHGNNASTTTVGTGGTGGTASGGDTNTTGANGSSGTTDPLGGAGGTGTTGTNGGPYGTGGNGQSNNGGIKSAGRTKGGYVFYYT